MRTETPEAALIAKTDAARLEAAIAELPLPFRETLVLRDVQGLDYREIAEVTKVPIGTVMSRLARARRRLIASIASGRAKGPVMTTCDDGPDLARARLSRRRARPRSCARDRTPACRRPGAGGRARSHRGAAPRHRGTAAARSPAAAASRAGSRAAVGMGTVPSSQPSWRALAASVVLAVFLGERRDLVCAAPAARTRWRTWWWPATCARLMAPQPTDVGSSDRHTVKPWFNGRIPEAPRVVDLADQGFPLVGGRIDVIGRVPVPTLVYRHRQHLISLSAVPAGRRWPSPPRAHDRRLQHSDLDRKRHRLLGGLRPRGEPISTNSPRRSATPARR